MPCRTAEFMPLFKQTGREASRSASSYFTKSTALPHCVHEVTVEALRGSLLQYTGSHTRPSSRLRGKCPSGTCFRDSDCTPDQPSLC